MGRKCGQRGREERFQIETIIESQEVPASKDRLTVCLEDVRNRRTGTHWARVANNRPYQRQLDQLQQEAANHLNRRCSLYICAFRAQATEVRSQSESSLRSAYPEFIFRIYIYMSNKIVYCG